MTGQNIFQSGGYGAGDVHKSVLYEYFIIFYIALLLFMNKKSSLQRTFVFLLTFYYIFKSLIYGGRIEVVIILIIFILSFTEIFQNKFKSYIIFIIGIFFMFAIGQIRTNPQILFNPALLIEFSNSESLVRSSQFGDVNQSSLRIIGLVKDGFITTFDRIVSFLLVTFCFFIPSSQMPEIYNLPRYLQNIKTSGGGGLISAYTYVWMSFLGPPFFGFFIGTIYRKYYHTNNKFLFLYSFCVVVTFPRWFAYYPATLFRFCLLIIIITLFYYLYKTCLRIIIHK